MLESIQILIEEYYHTTKNITEACEYTEEEFPMCEISNHDIGDSYIIEVTSKVNNQSIGIIHIAK